MASLPAITLEMIQEWADNNELLSNLVSLGAFKAERDCPKCGNLMTLKLFRDRNPTFRCRKNDCDSKFSLMSGTFFEGHHIKLESMLKVLVLWIEGNIC